MKKTLLIAISTLAISLVGSSITSCSTTSSKLTIVHFDQTILGDAQKDLSVSIGIKKGNTELQTKINEALASISSEKRKELMLAATERSTAISIKNEEGKPIYTVAPHDDSKPDLIVGLECNYSPFNWTETKANTYTYPTNLNNQYADGYDVQIAKYIAEFIGYNLIIQKLEWEVLIPSLENNTINAVIAGMTDTEDRRKSIDFTDPYYTSELVLVVKADSKYATSTSLSDFSGARIVSQVSTVTNDVIESWVSEFNVRHLTPLDTFATCALAVKNGSADAMTAELPVATAIVKGNNI